MNKNVLFVDCFNTIIRRNIAPNDVFILFAKNLGKCFDIEPLYIYTYLKKFKSKLETQNFFKYGETEFKLEDVFKMMGKSLKKYIPNFETSSFVKNAMSIYIETEKSCQVLNEEITNYLKEQKQLGKKIYVVSDFYCGKECFKTWLDHLNILNLFDDIFVSCDFMKSKRSGALYENVIKILKVKKKDILMIGDNPHADNFIANLHGIKSKKVILEKKKYNEVKDLKNGNNYLEYEKLFNSNDNGYNFSNYAFPLYLFEKKLYTELISGNIKNVFFLSREGLFLKTLFEKFCQIRKVGEDINTYYLEVSRNSLALASLKKIEEENFEYIFRETKAISLFSFLKTLSFSNEEIEIISNEIKANKHIKYLNFKNSKVFKNLIKNTTFLNIYNNKRTSQREAFEAYLKSFKFNFLTEPFTVVDVGWKGTMQDFISKFFNDNVKIYGFYIGSKTCGGGNSLKRGLLYQKGSTQFAQNIFHHKMYDYEQICRANHNRIEGYKLENGEIKVIYDTQINDIKNFEEFIYPMQQMIQTKFEKICRLDYKNLSNIEEVAAKMFYKMIKKTSKEDYEWLLKCENSHYDNFVRIGYTIASKNFNKKKNLYNIWNNAFLFANSLQIKFLKKKYK